MATHDRQRLSMTTPSTRLSDSVVPTTDLKPLQLSTRSRRRLTLMRYVFRPLAWLLLRFSSQTFRINLTARLARLGPLRGDYRDMRYRILETSQGYMFGEPGSAGPTLLYLHGGGFVLPVLPAMHLAFARRIKTELGAMAFVPDYRLAPLNPYPAALDDCERAYDDLRARGVPPESIVLAGESAGGNLVLALLLRLKRRGKPLPCCAVAISPFSELARIHAPPSRTDNAGREAILPPSLIQGAMREYKGDADGFDPELSPIRGDYTGCPPLLVQASDAEILRDDAILVAQRAREHGVDVQLDLWPELPHAFPLLERRFPEARQARMDIIDFIRRHLPESPPA